ncbi:MAG: pilus assembly protein N-terminal domain-containing protein [Deltaproteobacteria bacterium]|nr:pilus assembly protein N-terminal domain-containing protein [Deltaproteobacteria bacterium]
MDANDCHAVRRWVRAFLICWPVLFVALPLWAVEQRAQQLVKGQSSTLTTDYEIGDAAITDPSVCDFVVRDSRREVYLNARAPGAVTLTLWDQQGVQRDVIPVQVTSADLAAIQAKASTAIGTAGLRFVRRGDEIVLEGEVDSAAALARADALAASEPHVRNAVRLGAKALDRLSADIARAVGRPGITVRRVQDQLLLEGIAYSPEAAKRAEQIARIYHSAVVNLLEVRNTTRAPGERPMVHLDVYFMELKKSALRGFGVRWTPGATARSHGEGLGGLLGSAVGVVFNLLPKVHLARERGEAKILEHPNLVVKSGENAVFFSGSEVPYQSGQGVQFKEVGVKIEAEPIAYGDDVDLKINATISALGSGENRAIDRRTIATSAYCKSGESIILGGLWNHGAATSWNKIPDGVDTSSALFTLALSKDFQSRQSDFVIFVTPRTTTHATRAEQALQDWEALRQELERPPTKRIRTRDASRWSRPEFARSPRRDHEDVTTNATAITETPVPRTPAASPAHPARVIQLPEALQ